MNQKNQDAAESKAMFQPNVDIVSAENEVLIYADLPGAEYDGIDVSFDRGVLELNARIAQREPAGKAVVQEYAVGDFRRSFRLPEDYDAARASAEFRDGVLCLRVPKAQAARAHKIAIHADRLR